MTYRKFSADNLFTGYEMLGEDAVLITDEKGKVIALTDRREAGGPIEKLNGILSPGFINSHCHLELSHLKGTIPKGTGMVKFLLTVMGNRNHSTENILEAIGAAEKKMLDAGIVAVGDICNTGHTLVQKEKKNLYYQNFIEATGFVEAAAESRFNQVLQVFTAFKENASIVPHAPYSVSGKLFKLINDHRPASLMTIHNQESYGENELFEKGTGDFPVFYKALGIDISGFNVPGKTSIQSYLGRIAAEHSILLVHNTVTSAEDINWIKKNQHSLPEIFWCLCPNANLYINNMLADVPLLIQSGYKIVIGTDSLASNDRLDIGAELATLQNYFPHISIAQLLGYATINGAEALRITEQFGSFEKNKTPGVVLIENVAEGSLRNAKTRRIL